MHTPSLAQRIECLAQDSTARNFARVRLANGSVEEISYLRFLSIINKTATWLDANFPKPKSARDFPIFCYIGNLSLRLLALVVAAEKTRRRVLLVRRFAPDEVWAHLATETKCSTFLYDEPEVLAEKSKNFRSLMKGDADHVLLPPWASWFSCDKATPYPSKVDWEKTMDNPVCVFHTSGTTGTPKPVIWTSRRISHFASVEYLATEMGMQGKGMVSTFPLHHVGGFMLSLFWPVHLGCVSVLQERNVPNTPEEVCDILQASHATFLAASPSILTAMLKSDHVFSWMRRLSFIITGSSVLRSREVSEIQQNGGPAVFNLYGATETLPLRQNLSDPADWPYISFKPDSGVSFRHENDELYEFEVHKSTDSADDPAVFCTSTDLQIFRSKDMFTPHPQKPGLWRFVCRSDDRLKLASGLPIVVGPMEEIISECGAVDAAIVGQQGRPFTVLLIVPHANLTNENEISNLKDAVWPYVEKANTVCPSIAAVRKDMIIILPQRHRLSSITDKGTVNRHRLFDEFMVEIDRHFCTAAES